jgi:hypothetical protein
MFNFISSEIQRCVDIRNYCQIRCDQNIPSVENILNYSCSRDCVRRANTKEGKKDKITELARLIKSSGWKPKKNDKCDFLPERESTYRMCVVRKVRRRGHKKIVYIKYMKNSLKYKKAKVEYPSERLKKCGRELTARKDCNYKNT